MFRFKYTHSLAAALLLVASGACIEPTVSPDDTNNRPPVAFEDRVFTYDPGDGGTRLVQTRLWYRRNFEFTSPIVLISHGGGPAVDGHFRFPHLAERYAAAGYFVAVLNHFESGSDAQHRIDRPRDVSAVIDQLTGDRLALPAGFAGTLNENSIAHVGHSYGANTSHAVGGAEFTHGTFLDPRIDAIIPISPQGPGVLGSFDEQTDIDLPSSDNTWLNVTIPSYTLVGAEEVDSEVGAPDILPGYRLFPFERYPEEGDKYLSILPGQDHGEMGNLGGPEVQQVIAENTLVFLDVYLRGFREVACEVGLRLPESGELANSELRRKFAPNSILTGCDPA